jgi:hypothetical protein
MVEHYKIHAKSEEIRLVIPEREYFVLAPKVPEMTKTQSLVRSDDALPTVILEPADQAEVNQRVTVKGRIEGLNLDLRAWLVVRTPCGDLYPQCQVSRNSPDFESEVRIGLVQWGADEGAEYEINLVATRVDGDNAFYQYLKSGRDGFGPLLPADALVLDAKRVTRRDIRQEM